MTKRKELRTNKIRPMPEGCLVTGRGVLEAPRSQCVGHVWLTRKAKPSKFWQSGYVQGALCINCGDEIPPRDASWWMEAASPNYIRRAVTLIKEETQRLREATAYLKEALQC